MATPIAVIDHVLMTQFVLQRDDDKKMVLQMRVDAFSPLGCETYAEENERGMLLAVGATFTRDQARRLGAALTAWGSGAVQVPEASATTTGACE